MIHNLPSFENLNIVVIGDVILDKYISGECERISPEAPVPIINVNSFKSLPGGAANVACNLLSIGTNVILICPYGKDKSSAELEKILQKNRLSYRYIYDEFFKTPTKTRVLSQGQQIVRFDEYDRTVNTKADKIIKELENLDKQIDLIIFSDYDKGALSEIDRILEYTNKKSIKTLVDPKGANFDKYKNSSVITPNLKEFSKVAGAFKNKMEFEEKAFNLLDKLSLEALLITKGKYGLSLISKSKDHQEIPAEASEVFDVTGAGDTVISILAAMYATGASLYDAAFVSNIAAGISIQRQGTVQVTREELSNALTKKNEYKFITKIFDESIDLELFVKSLKQKNKKIVMTNGCFDLLHAGHVSYLEESRSMGDYLIVGVNNDESVRRLKGKKRPINILENRMKVIASLNCVDLIIPFSEDTPINLIKTIKPDIYVKGADYKLNEIIGADFIRGYGGEVNLIPLLNGLSTSNTISKISE